jgi:hypothetical protein
VAAEPVGYVEIGPGGATFRPLRGKYPSPAFLIAAGLGAALVLRGLARLIRREPKDSERDLAPDRGEAVHRHMASFLGGAFRSDTTDDMALLGDTEEVMHVHAGKDFLRRSGDDSFAPHRAGRGSPIGPHRSYSCRH